MAHKLAFALAIGLLQKYEKVQVIVACLVNVALCVYLAVAQPFNERARWVVEVLAQSMFTLAVVIIMLFVLEVELNMDVGLTVNMMMLSGMLIKMLYQFTKTAKAVIKRLLYVCSGSSRCAPQVESVEAAGPAGSKLDELGEVNSDDSLSHSLSELSTLVLEPQPSGDDVELSETFPTKPRSGVDSNRTCEMRNETQRNVGDFQL